MKSSFPKLLTGLIIAATVVSAANRAAAQAATPTDSFTNNFDASTQPSWIYWYGDYGLPGNGAITWDGTMDAGSNSASGSLEIEIPFTSKSGQQVWFGTFGNNGIYDSSITYNGTFFTNIEFDILVDPTTPVAPDGSFGNMYVSLVRSGTPSGGGPFNANNLLVIPTTASNQWVHLTVPVLTGADSAGFDNPGVIGLVFRMDNFDGQPVAPVRFWLDNVSTKFSGAAPPPPPPPTMSIERPAQGLNFFSGASDYEREEVRTVQTSSGVNYSWYGSNAPVTYSFTVSGYPGAGHAGFHTYIYMIPSPLSGSGDNNVAADYGEPNVIYLSLDLDDAGAATYTFRWKTNLFGSNGTGTTNNDFFTAPHPSISNPTALGTWSATFSNNTSVTLTAPSGSSTNFIIDPNLAILFTNIYLYFGVHADTAAADKGLSTTLSHIQVTGLGTANIDDNFLADSPGVPDPNIWELEPANTPNVFISDPAANFIVSWTSPFSTGYVLETNSILAKLSDASWSSNGLPTPLSLGLLNRTFFTTNDVPSNGTAFFRLFKPGP